VSFNVRKTVSLFSFALTAFEVASIKPAALDSSNKFGRHSGGPGTSDPELYVCRRCSLHGMIVLFYGLAPYEFSAPDWMDSELFDVSAKVPPETTKKDFQGMQQNLLVGRFKLAFHHEKRELQSFELVLLKGGPRLQETNEPAEVETVAPRRPARLDGEGFPILPPGRSWAMRTSPDNRVSERFASETMGEFAKKLRFVFQPAVPVFDETGLIGSYDFRLHWVFSWASPEQGGPSIFEALEKQLGLRLRPTKRPVDIFVIDHIERAASEN
jgi:uncharacterized protein (TIGR03435 family)